MDLSDIAMGRLQGNGSLNQGVIPIRYKRVPCPKPGNAYVWIQDGAGPYYFSISPVNTNGVGSVVNIEILSAGATEWIALERNQDYTTSRPQERYGAWVLPQGDGPINLPIGIRLTSPNGQQIVNEAAINRLRPQQVHLQYFGILTSVFNLHNLYILQSRSCCLAQIEYQSFQRHLRSVPTGLQSEKSRRVTVKISPKMNGISLPS
jgi:hypothetical protein